jgi:hypothetical protein
MNLYDDRMTSLRGYDVTGEGPHRLSEDELEALERQLGARLPADYRAFLTTYGGYAFDQLVTFPYRQPYAGGERGVLSVFFGNLPGDAYDLLRNRNTYRGRVPSDLLPVATDPGGNLIALALGGEHKGKLYFWDHEEEEMVEEGKAPGYSNVYLIANSFDDLMDSLKIEPD